MATFYSILSLSQELKGQSLDEHVARRFVADKVVRHLGKEMPSTFPRAHIVTGPSSLLQADCVPAARVEYIGFKNKHWDVSGLKVNKNV